MRTAEEWGRVAVSLPGWRWMPGMRDVHPQGGRYSCRSMLSDDWWTTHVQPDPDDPATAGCLLALLGTGVVTASGPDGSRVGVEGESFGAGVSGRVFGSLEDTIGRACIAAAAAIGRWPGGEG